MAELDGVGVQESLCVVVGNKKAFVVVQGWSNVITWPCVEVPGVACAGLVVDEDLAASRANWCGIIVEGPIEVFPGQ